MIDLNDEEIQRINFLLNLYKERGIIAFAELSIDEDQEIAQLAVSLGLIEQTPKGSYRLTVLGNQVQKKYDFHEYYHTEKEKDKLESAKDILEYRQLKANVFQTKNWWLVALISAFIGAGASVFIQWLFR